MPAPSINGSESLSARGPEASGKGHLPEDEAVFTALVENSRDVIALINPDGSCRYISPSVEEISGYTPSEVMNSSSFDFIHPLDKLRVAHSLGAILTAPDATQTVESRIKTKDGPWVWVEMRAANRCADPIIRAIVLNLHDITERKAAEAQAVEDLRRLDEAQTLSHIGSFEWDMLSGRVTWSDEEFRIFGYEPGSVTPSFELTIDHLPPEDIARFQTDVEVAIHADGPVEYQIRVVRPDKSIRYVNVCAKVSLQDGQPVRLVGTCQDITDLRHARDVRADLNRQREEGAEQLRLILDSMGEGIFGVDKTGLCTFINRAGAAQLGATPDHFVGRSMHDLTHHTKKDGSPFPFEECGVYGAITAGIRYSVDDEVLWRVDGTSFPVEYSSHPIAGPCGPPGAVVSFRDISQRKEMERDARSSEALFRGAFSAARTGIALINAVDGRYVDVNDALCDMVGYTREELMGLTWEDITHPADLGFNRTEVAAMLDDGSSVNHVSKRYVRRDGRVINVEIADSLVRDDSGVPLYFVTHVLDVTEKEKTIRALKESEELLQEVVNNSPALIYIKDRSGKYLMVNHSVLKVFAVDRAHMVGRTDSDLFPPEMAEACKEIDDRVFESLAPVETEENLIDSFGDPRTYLSEKFPLFDEGGACYALCGISTDITDRVRNDIEKERLHSQLRQSLKMEAVGQLAGGVAHDFNNILAVIINYADFLAADLGPDDPRLGDVQEISRAGEKAALLVHQLLAFSRKEVIAPQIVHINEVIADLHQLLRTSIGEDIELSFNASDGDPCVHADVGQVEQVLINLAVNARDAMPEGGSLEISTSVEVLDVFQKGSLSAGEYVLMRVSDTGIGVDPATIDRMFEPFFTTKQRGQGTGLGLSTVYGIVQQAKGEIFVDSVLGEGACFSIYLPVEVEQDAPTQGCEHPPPPISYIDHTGETVLLVEDEGTVRSLVARILVDQGFRVIAFPGGAEALEYCRTKIEDIDILLTDVVMPGMSGKALSDSLTLLRSDLKTLYMSGYTDEIIGRRGVLTGDEQLIQKPFKAKEVGFRIRTLLDGGVRT